MPESETPHCLKQDVMATTRETIEPLGEMSPNTGDSGVLAWVVSTLITAHMTELFSSEP